MELAHIAQLSTTTVSKIERGLADQLTAKTAASLGLALHEVFPLTETELVEFHQITGTPMHLFAAVPQLTDRDKERRQVQPYIDSMLARYTPESVLFFLQSIETMTRALVPRDQIDNPQELTHVSAPRYRADLNATEQIHTTYAAAPSPKAEKKPKNRRA